MRLGKARIKVPNVGYFNDPNYIYIIIVHAQSHYSVGCGIFWALHLPPRASVCMCMCRFSIHQTPGPLLIMTKYSSALAKRSCETSSQPMNLVSYRSETLRAIAIATDAVHFFNTDKTNYNLYNDYSHPVSPDLEKELHVHAQTVNTRPLPGKK